VPQRSSPLGPYGQRTIERPFFQLLSEVSVTNQPLKFVAQVTNRGRQLIDVKCEMRELESNKYVGELTASCLVVNPQERPPVFSSLQQIQ
jgi:hypothetical protein